MHVEAHVVLAGGDGFSRVQPHAHPECHIPRPPLRRDRLLAGNRRRNRVGRPRKHDEEGISLGAHFGPAVASEHIAKHPVVLSEDFRKSAVSDALQKDRRTFEICEEHCDGPRRKKRDILGAFSTGTHSMRGSAARDGGTVPRASAVARSPRRYLRAHRRRRRSDLRLLKV